MQEEIRARGGKRGWFALALFLLPALFVAGVALLPAAAQIPGLPNITPEQLQQLGQGPGGSSLEAGSQPAVVMQPDMFQRPQLLQSRLEQIMSSRAGGPMRQFGYEQLGSGRAVTMPQTGAVQDDYILGVGDEIVVSLRGQENNQIRSVVDRNGQVLLQRLNPIPATGRSFGSFRRDVEAAVQRAYVATNAFVSLSRVRQISVLISGEVNNPGQRLLTGLSSVVDALLLAGGVRKTGSLRNVRIQRGGREFTVDLYSVLTARGGNSAMRLTDGDRILVPILGQTVAISGLVRQPGIFELGPRQSSIAVADLLQLAGGQEVRGLYRMSLLRIDADGRTNFATVTATGVVRDSEVLFVQFGADQVVNQANLAGNTGLSGSYAITPGTRLSDLLRAPGALGNSPYSLFGLVVRRDRQSLMRILLPFTPVAVVNGREDLPLESDDLVKIFSTGEGRLVDFVIRSYLQALAEQDAATRDPAGQSSAAPGTQARSGREDVRQLSALQSYITNVSAETQRRTIVSLLDEPAPGTPELLARDRAEAQKAAQAAAPMPAVSGQPMPLTQQPAQSFYPSYQPGMVVPPAFPQQDGMNMNMGGQTQPFLQGAKGAPAEPARNFIETGSSGEGFAVNREVKTFGQLVSQLNVDPLVLVNFLVDHRARLEGAVRGPGDYLVGPTASLQDLVQAAGGTVNWADESGIELITTALDRQSGRAATQRQSLPLRSGTLASYIVRPRDQLRFTQIFSNSGIGSVTIQGEVRNPGTFSILRGDRLSDVLARAGGLTNVAYAPGTVFLRQSAARAEYESYQRAAREVDDQLILAMTRAGNTRMDPAVFTSMQIFVKELRSQKPVGRIAVVADPSLLAAQPEADMLLEADDVIYIPQRPSTISVLGQVMQPGSYPYRPGQSVGEYIESAGGYSRTADSSETFIVLPDGSARKMERALFRFEADSLPPGSTIVIPRDIAPFDLRQTLIDVTQILSQLAVSIASVAVISKQ